MDRRFLEGLGLEKDVIDKVLDQNGTEITALKTQLTTKDTEIKTLRADLITANNRVGELEKVNVEDLERQLQRSERAERRIKKNLNCAPCSQRRDVQIRTICCTSLGTV